MSVGGQIVIVIMCQGPPRASCGMGKTASSDFDTLTSPENVIGDDDDDGDDGDDGDDDDDDDDDDDGETYVSKPNVSAHNVLSWLQWATLYQLELVAGRLHCDDDGMIMRMITMPIDLPSKKCTCIFPITVNIFLL